MKYLLFYTDGFIKKFPLKKATVTIGWSSKNDLTIKEEFVSNQHLRIAVKENFIVVNDLDSTNGTYVNGGKIKEAVIKIGESFAIGGKEFFLKRGTLDEFAVAKELNLIFNKLGKESQSTLKKRKTRYVKGIYKELLKQVLKTGLKKDNINDFLLDLSNYLSNLVDLGSLFIVSKQGEQLDVFLSIKKENGVIDLVYKIIEKNKKIFSETFLYQPVSRGGKNFYSFPIELNENDAALIYIPGESQKREDVKIEEFLLTLAKEISLLARIISGNQRSIESDDRVDSNKSDIIAGSKKMKDLIKQTEKIAKSNIFILIQGESGTGKELFARLIHQKSGRGNNNFVAINCAAIPEHLLEAEFFGYEKGAFTGAYSQKKGKLELASGGTLILDEIGDMPFSLQARLLRALQENEFYRLGGTIPIKVNLRIISLTNKNIKELINEGKFREDLYYRLVHHVVHIPPLRERKEDISLLINHFSREFSNRFNRSIKGYSIKALKSLLNYFWPGNVRQLINEVNRLITLTDDGEIIAHDLISEEIKYGIEKVSETDRIILVLEKNLWNKTRTAKELGMTYRGLHKKMQRLKIEKPRD